MNEKKKIWSLFGKLKPIVTAKLLNPEDKYVRSGVAQLVVPLNAEEAEIVSTEEAFTALPSDSPNIWYVNSGGLINVPWEKWEVCLVISLKTEDMRMYKLNVSLTCYGCEALVSYRQTVTDGTIDQITHVVGSDKFPADACSAFSVCYEAVSRKIKESEKHHSVVNLFANTDITDYDSVMKFVDFIKDKNILKNKGHGIELFTYNHVVSLIDKSSKRVKVLVDRNGKAQFCRLEDFPPELIDMIRREKKDWELEVYNLSIRQFDADGQAFATWMISPYYYCPMDEDGFGEEEEYEVAVTCHIDTEGHLTDIPVWKPYTGPRR